MLRRRASEQQFGDERSGAVLIAAAGSLAEMRARPFRAEQQPALFVKQRFQTTGIVLGGMAMNKAEPQRHIGRTKPAVDELLTKAPEHRLPQHLVMEQLVASRQSGTGQEVRGMHATGIEIALAFKHQQFVPAGVERD